MGNRQALSEPAGSGKGKGRELGGWSELRAGCGRERDGRKVGCFCFASLFLLVYDPSPFAAIHRALSFSFRYV